MATPVTYPSAKRVLGGAKEVTQGTAVTPITFTYPCDNFEPEDKPVQIQDKANRGSMGMDYGRIQGVNHSEFTGTGPYFADVIGYLLNNILGDLTTTVATPNSHAFSVLNSGTAQPGSLTLVQWQGLPATSNSRTYPGACLSELTFKGNVETGLITVDFKGQAYPSSVTGSAPNFSGVLSTVQPIAAWRTAIGLGGTAAGAPNKTIKEWSVTIARVISVEWTAQNSQAPYIIQRGEVSVTGSLTFSKPSDETALNYLLNNTQPQLQILATNGQVAAALTSLQIDIQLAAFDSSKIDFGDAAVGYSSAFTGIFNSTNAGASGGLSPIKVTIQNTVAAGIY